MTEWLIALNLFLILCFLSVTLFKFKKLDKDIERLQKMYRFHKHE